ncbi:MAG: NUDIX domain-containing protein [Chloroflexi bacterium]|nr:NUDIX domain-containing protein [Chloroflexota bacterium]
MAPQLRYGRERPVCTKCDFIFFQGPKLAAAMIVAQEENILLVRRGIEPRWGQWSFPSGYVDVGEDPRETACREVQEETNLKVKVTGLVGVYPNPSYSVILIVYRGSISHSQPSPGEEALDVGFFPINNLPPLAFEHDLHILNDWADIHRSDQEFAPL